MAPFPLPLTELLGHWGAYGVYLLIGIAFGFVLEIAGFGNSKKLAAQFYFKDLTVLKVMFSAIVVAMVLVFGAVNLGLLDYNLIWVNPTYLWPGVIGGLIMGFGFIIGGFCPGTSLVAVATAKIDGIFFALGVFFGIFLFGESVGLYEDFWYSSYMGRFTLPELFGVNAGYVVVGIVLMALFMFWGGEKLEQYFGDKKASAEPRWRYQAALALFVGALLVLGLSLPTGGEEMAGAVVGCEDCAAPSLVGPSTNERWAAIQQVQAPRLAEREVQIHPGELLDLLHDTKTKVVMLDVRDQANYNLFHILDARHVPLARVKGVVQELLMAPEPGNTVVVVMSNDEAAATEAWKILVAESVPNVYILGGGVNGWLATFADQEFQDSYALESRGEDQLHYVFDVALGARYPAAEPDPHEFELEYTPKVELQQKRGPTSGGCG